MKITRYLIYKDNQKTVGDRCVKQLINYLNYWLTDYLISSFTEPKCCYSRHFVLRTFRQTAVEEELWLVGFCLYVMNIINCILNVYEGHWRTLGAMQHKAPRICKMYTEEPQKTSRLNSKYVLRTTQEVAFRVLFLFMEPFIRVMQWSVHHYPPSARRLAARR